METICGLFTVFDLVNIIAIFVQVLILIAIVWYAWETRALRIQDTKHLELLREQVGLTATPIVIPFVRPDSKTGGFTCTLQNGTNQPALFSTPILVMPESKAFYRFGLTSNMDVLVNSTSDVPKPATKNGGLSSDDVLKDVECRLGKESADFMRKHLNSDGFHICVIYKNALGKNFIVKRYPTRSENQVIAGEVKLIVED